MSIAWCWSATKILPEASFAVKVDMRLALDIAKEFQQNAIYYIENKELFLVSCLPMRQNSRWATSLLAYDKGSVSVIKLSGGFMNDITPDICDKFEDKVRLPNLPFADYGQNRVFLERS